MNKNRLKIGDQTNTGRLYNIIINDLDLDFHIGVFDFEHEKPQNVRINIEILASEPENMKADNYDNVVCYNKIIENIKKLSKQNHIELVETLAEEISKICLSDKRTHQAKIKIEKTEIIKETKSVGIEILRIKNNR